MTAEGGLSGDERDGQVEARLRLLALPLDEVDEVGQSNEGERGLFRLSCLQEFVGSFAQGLLAAALGVEQSPAVAQENAGPLRIRLGRKRQRLLVEAGGGRKGVEGERPVPRLDERRARTRGQLGILAARAPIEIERTQVVVRHHVGKVLRPVPGERLDPARCQPVHVRPPFAGDLAVGNVAYEDMPERVLVVFPATDVRRSRRTNSLRSRSCKRSSASLRDRDCRYRAAAPSQKTLPRTAPSCKSAFSSLWVSASRRGGDDPLHGLGQWQVFVAHVEAAVGNHANEFLRVERIPAGARQELAPLLGLEPSVEEGRDERSRVVLGERRQGDRGRVPLAATPARPAVEELGPCSAEDEERHVGRPFGHLVDEVEQTVVRPVEILEDEDERPLLGKRLEEAPPGCERLSRVVAARIGAGSEAGEGAEVALHPPGFLGLVQDVLDGCAKLGFGRLGVVALQDPGLRLGHLAQRPERDAVSVRQASGPAAR